MYRGIALIGNEELSGIYTVDQGIVDINGVGLYHLYYKDYSQDLVQSATIALKIKDDLFYGNKHHRNDTHHCFMRPQKTEVIEGYQFSDSFYLDKYKIQKKDSVFALEKNKIAFECTLKNNSDQDYAIEMLSYVHFRNTTPIEWHWHNDTLSYALINGKYLGILTKKSSKAYIYEDSPTDFSHLCTEKIIEGLCHKGSGTTKQRLCIATGNEIILKKGEEVSFSYLLIAASSQKELLDECDHCTLDMLQPKATLYWDAFFNNADFSHFSKEEIPFVKANLAALKAATLHGFVPADLTGHYYDKSLGLPCYYARDSLMCAKAFILSNNKKEAKEIIEYLAGRERNAYGEFYQRYNGMGLASEGANNNVFHQIDSIGYFMRVVFDYYKKYSELLVSIECIKELVDVIEHAKMKNGLVGEEGGVNEGVFGPAYITSSNMFIYGGVKAAFELFKEKNCKSEALKAQKLLTTLLNGIEGTFNTTYKRYDYGFVSYQEDLVHKYDTPQYFGLLYGFEDTKNMRKTHEYFLKKACFFEDGIGYSQQEYHHGPWIFNTAACAQYAYLIGDKKEYQKKYTWLLNHTNKYFLLPEAIDASDESKCFINPLTWACAEFISASFIRERSL